MSYIKINSSNAYGNEYINTGAIYKISFQKGGVYSYVSIEFVNGKRYKFSKHNNYVNIEDIEKNFLQYKNIDLSNFELSEG